MQEKRYGSSVQKRRRALPRTENLHSDRSDRSVRGRDISGAAKAEREERKERKVGGDLSGYNFPGREVISAAYLWHWRGGDGGSAA